MSLVTVSSPHLTRSSNTGDVMALVILATLPGLVALTWFFGWGNLINIAWACLIAVVCEALVLLLRKKPVRFYLSDGSALVTAILLGLALPSLAPWWLTLVAVAFAIIVAKHLYGGLGQNPFNPAMVGYALVLISFPIEMTAWPAPRILQAMPNAIPGFMESLHIIFPFLGNNLVDAVTAATPLDVFKHKEAISVAELWKSQPILSNASWQAWQFISAGYLIGGLYLLYRKVITWHIPFSLLIMLGLLAAVFNYIDPELYASPELHLLAGATMLCAFFIATDPVTAATSTKGKLVYGAGIGLVIYLIRIWGNYPDAVAFAVLLMNFAAPLIDHFTQPRTYGHKKPNRSMKSGG